MTRVAVLDDYQRRAHTYADWASLGPQRRDVLEQLPNLRL